MPFPPNDASRVFLCDGVGWAGKWGGGGGGGGREGGRRGMKKKKKKKTYLNFKRETTRKSSNF